MHMILKTSEKGVGSSESGVTGGSKLPYGYWDLTWVLCKSSKSS